MTKLDVAGLEHRVRDADGLKQTLAPFSASFEAGSFYAVTGPSGAGKTTLLSLLSLTIPATAGRIHWRGEDLCRLSSGKSAEWRRRNMGLVFQHSRLVSVLTVREHIALAARIRDKPEAEDRGFRLLEQLGMLDKAGHRPIQLSGGEKQRVAIVQALCADPEIVLADEPTASLDAQNSVDVARILRRHAEQNPAIVICVTHDEVVSACTNKVLTLQKAK